MIKENKTNICDSLAPLDHKTAQGHFKHFGEGGGKLNDKKKLNDENIEAIPFLINHQYRCVSFDVRIVASCVSSDVRLPAFTNYAIPPAAKN